MTATFKNNAQLQVDILGIWYSSIQPILNIQGSLPAIVFQPISAPIISQFSRNGGNALGISPQDAPLTRKGPWRWLLGICHILTSFRRVVMNIDLQWGDIKDDDTVISIAREIMEKAVALAKVKWFRTSFPHQYLDDTDPRMVSSSLATSTTATSTKITRTSLRTFSVATDPRIERNCSLFSESTTPKRSLRGYSRDISN